MAWYSSCPISPWSSRSFSTSSFDNDRFTPKLELVLRMSELERVDEVGDTSPSAIRRAELER